MSEVAFCPECGHYVGNCPTGCSRRWREGDSDDGLCECDAQARIFGGARLEASEREQGRIDDERRRVIRNATAWANAYRAR